MSDPRLDDLVELVIRLVEGEHSARVEPSTKGDQVDAVMVAMNMLAESLGLEHERRLAAEALLQDEVVAYDRAPAMFCSIDTPGFEIVKCNSTMATALGVTKEQLLQRRLLGYMPVRERADAEASLRAIRAGEMPQTSSFHLISKSGRVVPTLFSGTLADPETGRLALVFRDVSAERELEQQLAQAQRLEVMGRLGSGVAHDFNNVLTIILAAAGYLREVGPPSTTPVVDDILVAVQSGAGLTQQLLQLSSPLSVGPPEKIDLSQLVEDSRRLIELSLKGGWMLEVALSSAPLPVRVNPTQLGRVLLNLVVNARQAMPKGGRLIVRTARAEPKPGIHRALLVVQDDGEGITEEVMERIGEPFFTTKEDGSGLGLSGCIGIVEHSGGELEFSSEPGRGTTVQVAFPIAE